MEQLVYPAGSLRHVLARLDHGSDPLFRFVGGKNGEAHSDRFQRRPEYFVGWAVG